MLTTEQRLVFGRNFDPPPVFHAGEALAPPRSEVMASTNNDRHRETHPSSFSWPVWYHLRMKACPTFVGAQPCAIESDMWHLVRGLITPRHTVLEMGARFGTTSCVLAESTNNSGRVVSVEPDARVYAALHHNLRAHRCNVGVFHGTVGHAPQVYEHRTLTLWMSSDRGSLRVIWAFCSIHSLSRSASNSFAERVDAVCVLVGMCAMQVLLTGYGGNNNRSYDVRTREATPAERSGSLPSTSGLSLLPAVLPALLPHLKLAGLESMSRLNFTALILDCEGCLADVLSDALLSRPQLELLIIERDATRRVSYAEWHLRLVASGFERIWRLEDSLWGARGNQHMAYHRKVSALHASPPSCVEYAQSQKRFGWRCAHTHEQVRAGLLRQTYTCGSRLICLDPAVVNGSIEAREVSRARIRLGKASSDRRYLQRF